MADAVNRVQEVAKEEASRVSAMTKEAVESRAYLYPIKGVLYFLSHRDLWRPLMSKLAAVLTTSIGVTTLMFAVAFVPQMAIMAFTSGPAAAISAALLTLSESSTITNLISRSFFLDEALVDTFDGTLMKQDCTNLVSGGRQIQSGGDSMARLGKMIKKPFAKFTPNAIIRYLMYLPLNFIPVVGTAIFIILQGKRAGPTAHQRYFQLKEWNQRQREAHVEQNRGGYTSFGLTATLLEMVPFVSLFFIFTNSVGAALWAADLEKNATTAPKLREQAKKAE
ncbi:hypothetical protein LTR70_007870 [Exophiala xenobiotica]|uniref:Outer spore wall protein RRT8 n=1 Tax=Lithohypha guttulata TaxID=1690604 RepID=A0ABR0K4E5_9EURO|nr:hypothetical protein LTR24_007542 [Lithohypha guttulata]KAK5312953.1 hypothetical protein LTR70_007870 [Exophiala xenobiotica]